MDVLGFVFLCLSVFFFVQNYMLQLQNTTKFQLLYQGKGKYIIFTFPNFRQKKKLNFEIQSIN